MKRTLSFVVATVLSVTLTGAGTLSAAPAAEAYVHQAVALYNSGECVKAIGLLNKAIAVDPRYVRAYSWMGFCYAKLGRNQDAITAFRQVVVLAPKSDDARIAKQWIAKLQQPAPKPTTAAPAAPAQPAAQTGLVYLVTLPPVVGVTETNLPRHVQLFGEVYRRALVERRNWWQGRRPVEREWRVVYNLQRRFSRLRVKAGVEDGLPQDFTALFEVRADGNTLFVSVAKRSGDVPDSLDLDVAGVLQLELIVRGKDPLHTRDLSVVWGDPVVDSRPAANPPTPTNQPAPPAAPPGGTPPQPVPNPGASLPDIMDARCALHRSPQA
jgi:hypothetical protein